MATRGLETKPDTYDFLRPNGFKFTIDGLPNLNYTCQSVSLPGITLGTAVRETPFVALPLPGDKIVFSPLSIEFIISEGMQNYYELFEWIRALGFPEKYSQFTDLKNIKKNTNTLSNRTLEYSDATLQMFTSHNNSSFNFRFYDMFPESLENISFDIRTTSVDYLTATATFRYRSFDFGNN